MTLWGKLLIILIILLDWQLWTQKKICLYAVGLFYLFISNGGLVAQQLGRWIWDQKVHGSMPSQCTTK